jgi:ArsR family transcriptional regulator
MNKRLEIRDVEKVSKALGDTHRIKIMEVVKKEEWMECEEIKGMFNLSQSTISHHLKQLVDARLLIAEKEGRYCKYQINKEMMGDMTQYLYEFCGLGKGKADTTNESLPSLSL